MHASIYVYTHAHMCTYVCVHAYMHVSTYHCMTTCYTQKRLQAVIIFLRT